MQHNDQIENVQKRALRCIYQEENVTFEYLKDKYQQFSIHEQNIQSLMLPIYRIINNLSPELISNSFKERPRNILFVQLSLSNYQDYAKQADLEYSMYG